MRWMIILTLFCAALTVWADGFSYGKSFHMLHETDQLAVIDLDEEQADVSMHIAIDGIPAGETITYVLPFCYHPDGFSMEEMPAYMYRDQFVKPAHAKVTRMNRLALSNAGRDVWMAAGFFGLGFAGPFVMPIFAESRSKAGSSQALDPYTVRETAHARAELYKVQAKDLQQLVAQAGLPEKYAEPLKKYKTPYFAVMRLTGPGPKDRLPGSTAAIRPGGVCYRFRHAIPPEKRGEYVYPLGTGAAWAHTVLLTEVYVTCPDAYSLQVTAPTIGEYEDERRFFYRLRKISLYNRFSPEEQKEYLSGYPGKLKPNGEREVGLTERQFMAPMTTNLLRDAVKAPAAWYTAYLNSNPGEDIRIRVAPREAPWRLAFLDWYEHYNFLFAGVFAFLGWLVAGLAVIRPRWVRAGRPESLFRHTVTAMLIYNFWLSLLAAFFIVVLIIASWALFVAVPLVALALWGIARVASKKYKNPPAADWRTNMALYSWLLATAVFLALNGGLYYFVRWCEAVV